MRLLCSLGDLSQCAVAATGEGRTCSRWERVQEVWSGAESECGAAARMPTHVVLVRRGGCVVACLDRSSARVWASSGGRGLCYKDKGGWGLRGSVDAGTAVQHVSLIPSH